MSLIPKDLKYTTTHEWVRKEGDGTFTIGITDHAQEALGDLVFVELPQVGTDVAAGKEVAVVESVKAAADVYAPISGKVLAVNEAKASIKTPMPPGCSRWHPVTRPKSKHCSMPMLTWPLLTPDR